MHTCSPPYDALNLWLSAVFGEDVDYIHLLLEAIGPNPSSDIMRPYFESAHADARRAFHKYAKLDLHPDATADVSVVHYPSSLPAVARHGLFGEVLAGLVLQSYRPTNNPGWSVPVFLFRHHADVGKYLFHLARDPSKVRQLWGRLGDDFIGLRLGSSGSVEEVIVGEAKYRKTAYKIAVDDLMLGSRVQQPPKSGNYVRNEDGIWRSFDSASVVPEGLRQLQIILEECEPDKYAEAIVSIDEALVGKTPRKILRTDLVIIAGDSPATRPKGQTNISATVRPSEYAAGRKLQVVEVFLKDGATLIKSIYDSLWSAGPNGSA